MDLPFQIPSRPNLPFRGVENNEKAFRPLNHELREIRCVTLLPGSRDDPVACELVYTSIKNDLDTHIDYTALSYCWGNVKDTMEIILHGSSMNQSSRTRKEQTNASFRITRNLYIALKALRNDRRQHLWIDAICINQQNLQEKTHQVQLMAKIYSSAESVLVWLGPHDLDSQFLMRVWTTHLKSLNGTSPGKDDPKTKIDGLHRAWWSSAHPLWTDVAQDKVFNQIELEHAGEPMGDCSPSKWSVRIHESLKKVLERPWWSRIWVVQEVFLAPKKGECDRQVDFRIGDDTLRWQEMVDLINLVSDVVFRSDDKIGTPGTPDISQTFVSRRRSLILEDRLSLKETILPGTDDSYESAISPWRSPTSQNQLNLNDVKIPITPDLYRTIVNPWRTLISADQRNMEKDIMSLLTITSGFHASDPRDKLFALLQLATDTRQAMRYDPRLSPDYTKSTWAVFNDLKLWKSDLGRWGDARLRIDGLFDEHLNPSREWNTQERIPFC